MLLIIGLCCLGGLCSSVLGGIFYFIGKDKKGTLADLGNDTQSEMNGNSGVVDFTEPMPELPPQPEGQRWVDPAGRYSIVFPNDWEIMDPPPAGLEVAAITALESDTDDFAENVNIVLEAIPDSYSGQDYIEAMENGLETVTNYQAHDRGTWAHTGEAGAWIEYTANFDPTTTSHNYVFVVTDSGMAYIITASSTGGTFDRWKDQLRQIAETFRLE